MSRRTKLAVVALLFVVLGWLYIHTGRLPGGARQLEFRLASAARAELVTLGHDEWARLDMDGRVAKLSGIAPDEGARAAALAAVKSSVGGGGIVRVDDQTDLRMVASPYRFEARLEGDRLTLKGYAPDRGARAAIAARAALAFAGEVDSSGVEIASGAPAGADWLGAVDFAIAQLVRLQEGVLVIEDASMTVTGHAASRAVAGEVARQLRQAPAPFTGRTGIDSPTGPPPVEEPATDESDPATSDVAAGEPGSDEAVAVDAAAAPPPGPPPAPLRAANGEPLLTRQACQAELDALQIEQTVRFGFNDAELTPASLAVLDAAAGVARRCGGVTLRVAGHTDATGDPAFNVYLSEQRAVAVRDDLIGRGVDPAALTAVGFGAAEPAASNESVAGRAQNRRIEIDALERTEGRP